MQCKSGCGPGARHRRENVDFLGAPWGSQTTHSMMEGGGGKMVSFQG